MKRSMTMISLVLLLAGCATSTALNGMRWDEFNAAKYQLVVTHDATETVGCKELGTVRGTNYDDVGAAKNAAEEKAVILGGNTLLYTNLWSEWESYQPFRSMREIYHADGIVYQCAK